MTSFSPRLLQALKVGMVKLSTGQLSSKKKYANIVEPPNADSLTDEEWLLILQTASKVGKELEELGYDVKY